ncbi:unnamed protein product, partial [Didymodactylos carnosus]
KILIRLSSNIPNERITHFIRKEVLFKKIEEIFSKSNKYVTISGYAGSVQDTCQDDKDIYQRYLATTDVDPCLVFVVLF